MRRRSRHEGPDEIEALGAGLESGNRLPIPHLRLDLRHLARGDVGRVRDDDVETLVGRQGSPQIPHPEVDPIDQPTPLGIGPSERHGLGRNVHRHEPLEGPLVEQRKRYGPRSRAHVQGHQVSPLVLGMLQDQLHQTLGLRARDESSAVRQQLQPTKSRPTEDVL